MESQVAITSLSTDHVALILRGRTLDPSTEPQLRAVIDQARELSRLAADIGSRRSEIERIGSDQVRLRENLKALRGSDAERQLIERYTGQLNVQEDRLDALRREMETIEAQRVTAQQTLNRLVAGLSLDVQMP